MSRSTKWKIEKAKVKVVFRLQFHSTQIPQSGWEKLFISFIPTETGKATAKTSKAIVRNGTCKWADPIYETTRLLVDSKTKQYDDKLYKLVVGMGTSRSSILGEATLNLSDYADASQPAAIALPLHGSDHGTVLHVTVQLLTAKTGFREFEQQRDKGLQRETEPSAAKSPSSGSLTPEDLVNKVKTRIHIREETNLHEEYSDSQVTCDESSNASESYFADKNDSPSNHEKSDVSDHADMAIVFEENHRLRGSLEIAESSISELKMELSVLQNHANEMGTETQKFAQELASEIASSQELAKEVTVLKSECSKFKHDLQQLKEVKSNSKLIETEKTEDNKEIKRVTGVGFVEDKIREMQEKTLIGFREADLSFLNSDLEMLLGMVQDLKKETVEPESMLQFGEIPSVPVQEPDSEKAEKEILVKKMDQMESYYEALVQELEENQKRILGELETHKTEMNDLSAVNNELQKRSTISESALKRARLNYSIAVSQLQKDLDMLSFQVLSMFETNQTVIKESFPDNSQPVSKHISNDLKESLSLQENIYKKVEEELYEMCCANLCLDVYSGTLKETLVEASDHLRKTNKKLQELAQKLQLSNQSRDVLVEDVRALNGENTYYLAKCNDLHVQNQMLEKDLGNVSNENFLLMEKITECEALLMDYRVYKSKHEVVSGEKMSLEKELETLKSENDDMKRKFKNSLHDMVAKLEIPNESFDKLQMKLDSVANKFKSSLESKESHLENNEAVLTYLSSLELELQKVSSEDKNFHEQIMGLDMMIEEFEKSKLMVSELKQERQDLILKVESKNDEFSKVLTELGRLKESFRFVNDELDVERSTVTSLTLELKSQRSELDQVRKHASDRELENNEIQENMICDDLKLTFVKTQYETQIDELVKQLRVSCEQCRELEKKHLENETRYIKESESLQMKANDTEARLNDCMLSEARYTEENEKLSSELKSVRLELDASFAQNAVFLVSKAERDLEVGELKDMLTKSKAEIKQRDELQMKFEDTESRLKLCLENEARYIEENMKLSTELESVRFELETSIAQHAKISVSQYERDLEVGQLKDMLTKSNEEIEQYNELQMKLQMKLQDTESRLKVCLENEARYVEEKKILSMELESLQIKVNDTEARLNNLMLSEARCIEENKVLSTELESVRLELEASISQNAEISVSKNERDLEVGQMKDMLTKSKVEIEQYNERQMKFQETESRLICSLENEARYIEENKKLSTELESVKLELETSIAQNAEISVSKNEHAFEVGQLKDMLTTSKAEIEQYSDLQTKFQDTESRLNLCLENEARYIEENRNLATELESLQMKIKDTEARLNDCMSSEARYIEDNEKLSTELESVKLELEAFIAQNSVLRNECDIEVEQLKGMLSQSKAEMEQYSEIQTKLQDTESRLKLSLENEALYIDENRNLATEIESLKLELDASIAQNAEISVLKSKSDHEVGQLKDMLSKSNSEIELYNELQMKFQDTESRLKLSLENEARYIEENRNLVMELELVRLELKAFIAHNAEILESKDNNKDGSSISEKESEIVLVVLKAKLDEQNDELITLQNKCSELTNKLSEQILKTEEFKNMSIYLKELKDNADMAREKKEPEGPSESLRVAFIKEQYQAKLQEVKQQLTLSKKHNEEMLFKLQDALDEIENRKKSEASQLKRIQELEMEVDSVNSDKPGFDRIKAELECALLSLECCKEEKEKLVALLQECEDEKSKIAAEFSMVKEKRAQKEENGHTGANGSIDTKDEHSITSVDVRSTQEVTEREYQDGDNLSLNDSKQLMVVNDQFRTQHLRSCMEQLEEELEKMKNDNSPLPLTTYDPSFQDLQRELAQLNEANEELGSIYPNFVNFPGNGNALERVLALEIELAEALRSKKKPSIQFQSSFLKQHSDEEAVFKSFRDINELIKDMLEIKGKYVNVESELKEMHDRYSQLSLQFAEVEGERQKLMMTLKNVRSSRNLLRRSSMTALEDQTL